METSIAVTILLMSLPFLFFTFMLIFSDIRTPAKFRQYRKGLRQFMFLSLVFIWQSFSYTILTKGSDEAESSSALWLILLLANLLYALFITRVVRPRVQGRAEEAEGSSHRTSLSPDKFEDGR